MIVGIGIDVVEIARVRRAVDRFGWRFGERVLTAREDEYCRSRADRCIALAGRLAAKEATIKALCAPEGLRWRDMEVTNRPGGAPELTLHGVAGTRAAELRVAMRHVSITHDGPVAAAVVVLEAAPGSSAGEAP